ncbi:hypothetical protein [Nocardia brasiliensis]|uniref:hypothetical protein n=1 Tax=Nocardia brasiliensis TaxID=37326 RepID=UPI00366AECA6
MSGQLRAVIGAALLCASMVGCANEEAPVDTSSTKYLYDEVLNPCREMPGKFLSDHHLDNAPKALDNLIDGYIYWGCKYSGQAYDFGAMVSNSPLSQVAQLEPHTVRPVQIAGRAAKIQSLPLETKFCNLYIEMTGGILSLYLVPKSPIEACPTLTTVAEELVPLLPPGV